jgi:hypothetical protein
MATNNAFVVLEEVEYQRLSSASDTQTYTCRDVMTCAFQPMKVLYERHMSSCICRFYHSQTFNVPFPFCTPSVILTTRRTQVDNLELRIQ